MSAIEKQEETEVYATQGGWICIQQDSVELGREVRVFFRPEHVAAIVKAIRATSKEIKQEL